MMLKALFLCSALMALTPTAEVLDKTRIYPCKYGKQIGFMKYFEFEKEWQCIPCFAAMDEDEVAACKKFKEKKRK
jgi:hypothetical protein